jgi:hypothetical protein
MLERLRRWLSRWPGGVEESDSARPALTHEERAERQRVLDRWYERMKRTEGDGGSTR